MEWFRMYAEFATDPKVQSMPEAMQRRLLMLMCLRSSNVLETLHETDISFALRIDETQLSETKALFMQKRFVDDDWNLLNWDKRQMRSDSSTERVRAHREKTKQQSETGMKQDRNVTETAQSREEKKREEKKETKADAQRASRLPADWSPSEHDGEFCTTERPDLDIGDVANQFRDYWIAQPGAKGRKTDWPATWRNWVRNQRGGKPGGQQGDKPQLVL